MKRLQPVLVAIGLATMGWLLWKLDARAVGRLVLQVGWGLAFILPLEIVAHVFNAVAWRLSFPAEHAASFPLPQLIRLRIAGDAVNYLTPTANVGGEFARTAMLDESHGTELRAGSVFAAKVSQALAQAFFGLGGLLVFAAQLPLLRGHETALYAVCAGFVGLLTAGGGYIALSARRNPPGTPDMSWKSPSRLAAWLGNHWRQHPVRSAGSLLFFLLGYAWGAFEAYWICRFLGLRVGPVVAMMIEVLSITVDLVFFMVPAKLGTQEGGKTAIFAALGLPVQSGLAFGVIRHLRELAWAGLGLVLCSVYRRPAVAQ